MSYKRFLLVCIFILAVMALLLSYSEANGCNGGKCSNPLPTHAQTRACDGPGVGPVHKCQPPASPTVVISIQETPEPASPSPTSVPASPTAGSIPASPTSKPVQPTVQSTAQPTVSPTSQGSKPAACSELDDCDPCAIVRDAMDRGMVIIIADEDHISISDVDIVIVREAND